MKALAARAAACPENSAAQRVRAALDRIDLRRELLTSRIHHGDVAQHEAAAETLADALAWLCAEGVLDAKYAPKLAASARRA